MKPGDMVRTIVWLDFYPSVEHVNKMLPADAIESFTLGMVISPPNGTWIKWLVNGKVGWSNHNFLEVI